MAVRVGVEWINTFHADACQQCDLNYRDDHAEGFLNEMVAAGHERVFDWGDDNAWEREFRHPSHGGCSLDVLDNVHFMFYSDHGGNWDNTMHIAFSSQNSYCLGASSDWILGDKMLKWFVLDCCQCVLNTDGGHVGAVWFPPWKGLHMLFGFIGNGHDGAYNANLGRDFGRKAAAGAPLLDSWLYTAYSKDVDDNPIVICAGATQDEGYNRADHETIYWRDYDVSASNALVYFWLD